MLGIVQAAGWPIWFLLSASVVALSIIVERFLSLRRSRILPAALLPEVIQLARAGRVNAELISELELNSPLGRVLAAGMRRQHASREKIKEAMEEAGHAVAHELERYLNALGTVATLAPLLGLFGTVVGMIELFGVQTPVGVDPAHFAHGISVALYNTGFGLAVAMPALVFYRFFRGLVDSLLVDMEQQSLRFIDTALRTQD